MTALIITVGVLVALGLLYLFMIWPKRPSKADYGRFARRSYAHRGLFDNEDGVPENSLAAFEAAMQNGYGCELDVQFTKDKQLIVFHDNDYLRVCGVDTPVWELTYDEIREFRLLGGKERVPLFSEVLALVDGRQPLIVEVKAECRSVAWYYEVCAATLRELRGYRGDYCVESFHPMVVRWFRKNAPDIVRGQLLMARRSYGEALSAPTALLMSSMLTNCLTRPHFMAYREDDPFGALHLVQRLGAMTVMWTVKTPQRHDELIKTEDAVIFDHYQPAPRF